MKNYNVIGLMSGTSFDGIDASFIYTDGEEFIEKISEYSCDYEVETVKELSKAISNTNYKYNKTYLDKLITKDHFSAVKALLKKTNITPDFIGFHGQTIFHNAEKKISIQLGSGQILSKMSKTSVVSDFRLNDIKNGGHGAPIAPIYHKLLMKQCGFSLPACILNIGGVANITYWDGSNLLGFDTGPGNGLMDFYLQNKFNIKFDENGSLAKKGQINHSLVNKYINQDYFKMPPPKSLDKLTFVKIINDKRFLELSLEDSLATLLEFSIRTIIISLQFLPKKILSLAVVGGGNLNEYLIKQLKKRLHANNIFLFPQIKDSQFIEAEMIAYLTIRCVRKLPYTFPSTTGVSKPMSGGNIFNI